MTGVQPYGSHVTDPERAEIGITYGRVEDRDKHNSPASSEMPGFSDGCVTVAKNLRPELSDVGDHNTACREGDLLFDQSVSLQGFMSGCKLHEIEGETSRILCGNVQPYP